MGATLQFLEASASSKLLVHSLTYRRESFFYPLHRFYNFWNCVVEWGNWLVPPPKNHRGTIFESCETINGDSYLCPNAKVADNLDGTDTSFARGRQSRSGSVDPGSVARPASSQSHPCRSRSRRGAEISLSRAAPRRRAPAGSHTSVSQPAQGGRKKCWPRSRPTQTQRTSRWSCSRAAAIPRDVEHVYRHQAAGTSPSTVTWMSNSPQSGCSKSFGSTS